MPPPLFMPTTPAQMEALKALDVEAAAAAAAAAVAPTEPAEPVAPTEPAEPAAPTEPAEPTEPTEPAPGAPFDENLGDEVTADHTREALAEQHDAEGRGLAPVPEALPEGTTIALDDGSESAAKSEARKLTWTKPKVAPEPRPTVCVKHYPNNPQFNRWAVNNSNNETIAYAYCAQLAETIARLLNADPASGHWAI